MSKEERRVPELRFKGFHDDWEQRKLKELCEKFQSGKYIKATEIFKKGEYPVYGGNGIRGYTSTYNNDGFYALIGRQGALCGNMNISHGKAYFTEHAIAVKGNNYNNTRYLYYLLDKMNLGQYSGQSAQPGLAVNTLVSLKAIVPNLSEQSAISMFMENIDRTITLHQRKYTQLIRLKKAYLEKIFNQELVFKNEKSIWEEKKFEEFMYKPEKLLKASNIRKNELLTVKLFGKGVEIANQNRSLKLGATTYYKRFAGDFIYGKQNFFNGAFGFISENLDGYYSSGDVPTLKFNSKIVDRPFFLNYISREIYYKRTEAYSSGTGSKRIHEDTLLEFKIKVPLISEQRRIGILLNRIDDLINFYSHRLKNLNAIKYTYLNKMFI